MQPLSPESINLVWSGAKIFLFFKIPHVKSNMQLKLTITDLNVKKAQYREKKKIFLKSQNESRSKQELKFTVIALLAGDVANW